MAGKKRYDVFKRDVLLLKFMKEHKGKENTLSSLEIQKFLNDNGYSVKKTNICMIMNRIMYEHNAPICYSNSKGYYWAQTREEIESTIADMESRRASLQEHIDHLKNFIIG